MRLAAVAPEIAPDFSPKLVTFEEYLAAEELATNKHKYIGGYVYGMDGGMPPHSLLFMNMGNLWHAQLRGKRCRVFNSDMKVRVDFRSKVRGYYPDVQVVS